MNACYLEEGDVTRELKLVGADTKHHEWREGSDPFNARQPGEVAKVPKSAWRTGAMRRFGKEGLTSSISIASLVQLLTVERIQAYSDWRVGAWTSFRFVSGHSWPTRW